MIGHLPEVAAERGVTRGLALHVLERALHLTLRFGEQWDELVLALLEKLYRSPPSVVKAAQEALRVSP